MQQSRSEFSLVGLGYGVFGIGSMVGGGMLMIAGDPDSDHALLFWSLFLFAIGLYALVAGGVARGIHLGRRG